MEKEFKLPILPKYTGISTKGGSVVKGYFFVEFNMCFIIDEHSNRIGVHPHSVKIDTECEWYRKIFNA